MSTDDAFADQRIIRTQLRDAVALFGLVGAGLGVMGLVALSQFGGGFLSGIVYTVILVLAMFFGPVLAVVVSLRLADYAPRKDGTTYVTSFVGNVVGYLVMMLVVVAMLFVGLSLTVGGGGGSGVGGGGNSGGSFDFDLLLPVLALAVPTGLTGVGATFFHRPLPVTGSTNAGATATEGAVSVDGIPRRWLVIAGVVVVLLLGLVAGVGLLNGGVLSQGDPSNLKVTGVVVGPHPSEEVTIAEVTIENVGEEPVTTTLTAKQIIEGGTEYSADKEITINSGETKTSTVTIVEFSEYSPAEKQKLENRQWSSEILIDGELRKGG